MKIKFTLMMLSALTVPVLYTSCGGCTAFNVDVVDIPHHATKGTVASVAPVQVPLTPEEAAQVQDTSKGVIDFIFSLSDDKKMSQKEREDREKTKNLLGGVTNVGTAMITKAGQQITVKNSKGGTTIITQPVYCHFGEIQLGEKGRIVHFNGRRVFFPTR